MKYYISDLHIGDQSIFAYEKYDFEEKGKRYPFMSCEERDHAILANWRACVAPKDFVYILGDISMCKTGPAAAELLDSLPGRKILVMGNHDRESYRKLPEISKTTQKVCDLLNTTDAGQKLFLCHYPVLFWNGMEKGTLHLYGHVHCCGQYDFYKKALAEYNARNQTTYKAINVSACAIGFTPRTLKELETMGAICLD